MKVHTKFIQAFGALLIAALLFAALPAGEVKADTLVVGPGETYTSIQAAIDAANPYDTIEVAAGEYVENIVIDKPLTLLGPNHEIAGDSENRVDEAIILNSVELGTNIIIESTDVTIKGFFLEGNEKARNGIWFNEQFAENTDLNITIQNNIIQKMGNDGSVKEERGRGIYFTNPLESSNTNLKGKPYVYGIDISYNYVQFAAGGIILRDNVYANIGYNKVENANEGILVEWVMSPIDPSLLEQHTVHHNTVIIHDEYGWNENTGFAEYYPDVKDTYGCSGIRLNVIGGGAKVIARENNVSASTASNDHAGFNVASLNSGKVQLFDNVITDVRDGIRLWGTQESGGTDGDDNPLISQNFQVFGGTITGGHYGIHITDWYYRTGYDETIRGSVGLQNRVYLDGNLQISGQSGHKIRIFNDYIDYRDVTVKIGMNLVTNVDFDNPDDVEKVNVFVDLNGEDVPNTRNEDTAEIFIIKLVAKIGDNYYSSIQEAIDAASAYDTINVAAGTYAELLTITKPLTLLGPNADIDGTTGTRTDEAIITFPEGDNSGWSIIDAESNDITVNGFTFKNDQIVNSASGGWDLILIGENIEFVNNRVISQAQQKIPFKIQGPFTDSSDPNNDYAGAIVKYNYFESPNTYWSTVIMQGIGATVQNNTMVGGSNGIQIQPYSNTVGGIVSHNDVSGYIMSIWHNYQIGGNGLWIYEYNNVSAPIPPTTYYHYGVVGTWGGIRVQTQTPNIEVRFNTFNGENDDYTLDTSELLERNSLGVFYWDSLYSGSQINVHDNIFVNVDQNVDNQTLALGDLNGVFANNTFERSAYIENGYLIYTSIQDAIDAAADGDTIEVGPGTYNEKLVIDVPNLTIKSTDGAAATIINVPDEAEDVKNTGVLVNETNLGVITFDGFTVQNFTENGIVQGMAAHEGTTFHVLNNIVMPKADYLRNGIQVSGDGSTVIGNTIQGAPLTEDWAGSGIMVVNASDVTVKNNTVSGGDIGITIQNYSGIVNNITINNNTVEEARIGLALYGREGYRGISNITMDNNTFTREEYASPAYGVNIQTADVSGITFTNNLIENVSYGFRVSNTSATVAGPVSLRHNQFVYNYYPILYYNDPVTVTIDAKENWWDSIAGPAESGFGSLYLGTTGLVDYIPWCGDPECSFLVYPLEGEITETVVIDSPIVYLLKDGTVINPASGPCFDITASYVTIMTESPAGAVCYPGSPGIQVAAGVKNITIEGLEIDGEDTAIGNGIDFLGAVTDVIISDTYIHDMVGDGVHFAAQPDGFVEIKGNLFMDNTGEGVDNSAGSSAIDATFNAWGDYSGPKGTYGDDVSDFVTYDPWTHVDVYVSDGFGSRYLNEVALGEVPAEGITYSVYANLQKAHGAQFTLTYDPVKLQVSSTSTDGTVFPYEWTGDTTETVAPGVDTSVPGKITFAGGAITAVSGEDQFLFSVTFTGAATTDELNPLFFDELDEDWYGMNPLYGSSLNIYAAGMVGIADVNVYDLPTLKIVPLENFAVGNAKEFTLTVTNPATGRDYTALNVDLVVPDGAVLEYWDGDSWELYEPGVDIGELDAGATADVLFHITFATAGDINIPVTLNDGTTFLVDQTFTFTVLNAFTVTGTVQMQGRTERAGVLIELAHNEFAEYMYDTLSTNIITDNYTLLNVADGLYTLTITHDRYLDFVYTSYSTADLDLTRLELRGGDVQKDNLIDIFDASLVGLNYGAAGNNSADANFDSTVNIQDLAMIGGNFDLQSTVPSATNYAYGTWTP